MDPSKLKHLRQVEIAKPCTEDWDAMEGNDCQRFCAGCGCFVHNITAMEATAAERLLSGTEKVCTRILIDVKKGVLTRDGWIPRLALAGAVASSVTGCHDSGLALTGSPATRASVSTSQVASKTAVEHDNPRLTSQHYEEESNQTPELGWPNIVCERQPRKAQPKRNTERFASEVPSLSKMNLEEAKNKPAKGKQFERNDGVQILLGDVLIPGDQPSKDEAVYEISLSNKRKS